jgi:polysaccharide biosynthesis protein PslH
MNILILSPFFPYPLTQGGKIRVFNIIKYLARNHRITLACLSEEKVTDYGPLKDYCEGVLVTYKKPSTAKDLFRFLTGPDPFNYVRYASAEMRAGLAGLADQKSFDAVLIEFSMMWQYADIFRGTTVALDEHNIEYNMIRQLKDQSRGLRKILYGIEEKRVRKLEEQAWRECSHCFTVSGEERDIVAASAGHPEKVTEIRNCADLERFVFLPRTDFSGRVLFLCGMDYLPGLDSALYFMGELFPLIREKLPEIKLDIVGRDLHKVSGRFSFKGVEYHENVPDVLPWFRKADLLVVPLRYGAGTRIKIIEAMAAGLPVVSTSKGSEGIAASDGRHLLLADTPEDFAGAVARLMGDRGLAEHLARHARQLVEERYSWEKGATMMATVLAAL